MERDGRGDPAGLLGLAVLSVGTTRRITFDASPGTYEVVCAIPGHTQAGMKGTLAVR